MYLFKILIICLFITLHKYMKYCKIKETTIYLILLKISNLKKKIKYSII